MLTGNLLTDLGNAYESERFDTLLINRGLRVERIVSNGQASEPGFWYDQDWDEWVLVLQGCAMLEVQSTGNEATDQCVEVRLEPGDHFFIAAHQRHRVAWTDPARPTVWLALHWDPPVPVNTP